MPVKRVIEGAHAHVKVYTDDIEPEALAQLENVASLPFVHHHVAAMPDVHWGLGATIGSVIATDRVVIPAAVGVDIGCGMCAARLSLTADQLPDDLRAVRQRIERDVPLGFHQHEAPVDPARTPSDARLADALRDLAQRLTPIVDKHPAVLKDNEKHWCQVGTLGGGNHFIELCLDEADRVWVLLHSGSRNVGKRIADVFIAKARHIAERYLIPLPDPNLAYLADGSEEFADYIEAVSWAQDYALANRRTLLALVLNGLTRLRLFPEFTVTDEAIHCHHNYVAREHHFGRDCVVTRKGAIRARAGDLGIIPGSMGARSFIVRGKGEPDSFCSCSHGAGRRMSRKRARREFTTADLAAQTAGVECRKDGGVLDEIPGAYKSIDEVMQNQSDLVEVLHTLRQVLCVKG